MNFDVFYKDLRKTFNCRLWLTSAMAAGVSACAVGLLGLSGWFLTGAAIAGATGPIMVQTYNYLLPSAFIRFFAVARTGLRYGERYIGHSAALRAMATLRPALFARMADAEPDAILRLSRGEASSRFIQDVTALESALVMESAPASALGGIVIALLCCLFVSPVAAVVVLLLMAGAVIAGLRLNHAPEGKDEQAAMGALKERFQEVMGVLPDIHAYDLKAPLLAEFEHLEDAYAHARLHSGANDAYAQAATLTLSGVALACVAAVSWRGGLAEMSLALLATSAGFESLSTLIRALSQSPIARSARARVAEVFDLPHAMPSVASPAFIHGGRTFPIDRALRLRLEGPSGSGKTRLMETLIGLRGREGLDRSLFSLCPQDASFLTGTVRDNLTIALSDDDLKAGKATTEARLWTALDDAALGDRIRALPRGLDTWIGDGGVTLSGGERKRLALARAYIREAPVLVLDEPTEGLDMATEAFVVERLEKRLSLNTQGLILISHREAPRRLATQSLAL